VVEGECTVVANVAAPKFRLVEKTAESRVRVVRAKSVIQLRTE
jgi:hypothetical protein